jgi:PhzF family phenazine biosynthesis protein
MQAWVIDTFAEDLYQGNPAGVIVRNDGFPSTESMQSIAFHLGLPTTAFVVPGEKEEYQIRWFTPKKELNICGHATIGAAGYLYEIEGANRSAELRFHTPSGPLYARREGHHISLNLPLMDFSVCDPPSGLDEALGARILYCARAVDDILIEVESENVVADLQPDFDAMRTIRCRGHIVTARGDGRSADFVSRSFFPALGVDEDQVCVSAHCKLGPYWAGKLNKRRLSAVQLSPRGGRLILEVTDDRVHVAGTAIVRRSTGLPITEQERASVTRAHVNR